MARDGRVEFQRVLLVPLVGHYERRALGVSPAKLSPLFYALAPAGLLTVDNGRFANTPKMEAYRARG